MATENVNELAEEKALDDMANFGAQFDDGEMERLEAHAGGQGIGQARRMTLVALARDADMLSNLSLSAPDAFGAMRDAVDDFAEHAKHLLEAATAAQIRLTITDCREGAPI